jgi:hypothetical protein
MYFRHLVSLERRGGRVHFAGLAVDLDDPARQELGLEELVKVLLVVPVSRPTAATIHSISAHIRLF